MSGEKVDSIQTSSPLKIIGQTPEGTYAMLESLLEGDDTRIWGSVRHMTFVRVFAERECIKTNGSCMDLLSRHRQTTSRC